MEDDLNLLLNGRISQFKLSPARPELGTAQPQFVLPMIPPKTSCSYLVLTEMWQYNDTIEVIFVFGSLYLLPSPDRK